MFRAQNPMSEGKVVLDVAVPPAPAFWAGTAPSVTLGHRPALAARCFDAVEARVLSCLPLAAAAVWALKGGIV